MAVSLRDQLGCACFGATSPDGLIVLGFGDLFENHLNARWFFTS